MIKNPLIIQALTGVACPVSALGEGYTHSTDGP
jgi:hypothetical protein